MATFTNLALTNDGRILFADVQAGAVLVPTKIVIGSGYMPTDKTPATMTDVVTTVKELAINKKKRSPDGKATFGGAYSNSDVVEAFYLRELALYCKAEYRDTLGNVTRTVGPVLYIYGNAGDVAEYMEAYSSNTVVEKQVDIVVYVGNDAAVDLTIESGVYVTQEQLAEAIASIDTSLTDSVTGVQYKLGVEDGVLFLEEM